MIKNTLFAALAVAVTGLFGAAPADAQDYPDYRLDLGINGGGSWYSDMLDDDHLPAGSEDVMYETGWLVGAQATLWLTDRFGLRANGTYTERPLTLGSYSEIGFDESTDVIEDINLWNVSGDLMIRLLPDGYSMGGIASYPYLALGAGARYTDLAVENPIAGDLLGRQFGVGDDAFAIVEEWHLMGLVGLGTDLRLADMFAIRLEVGDRIWDAPFRDMATVQANPDEDVGNVTHEVYGQIGLHLLLGLEEPEVVAVTPAPPAPAPAPEPEPEPEPEPVEEAIMVCVVDPSADAGLMEVEAIYMPETGDTLVVQNGMRRDFATIVPDVMMANEVEWFVQNEPLTLETDGMTLEYTTWQSARMIDADQLYYVGMVRGLPVYANASDVADIRDEWEELRDAAMTDDVNELLEERAELAEELEEIQYLYVPLRPTGCVFQAVRQVEQVRKK